jgi:hypothetical protein
MSDIRNQTRQVCNQAAKQILKYFLKSQSRTKDKVKLALKERYISASGSARCNVTEHTPSPERAKYLVSNQMSDIRNQTRQVCNQAAKQILKYFLKSQSRTKDKVKLALKERYISASGSARCIVTERKGRNTFIHTIFRGLVCF